MPPKQASARYLILLYRRSWDRLWKPTMLLGIILGFLWWHDGSHLASLISDTNDRWILLGAVISLGVGLFALFARNMGYVQLLPSYFQVVTPFLKLKVSYRRVRSAHPVSVVRIFPPNEQSWARKRFLQPFYGMIAMAVELQGYPLSPALLRLFLPKQFFLPQTTGFVLLVKDWMAFSTALDTYLGAWRNRAREQTSAPGLMESLRKQRPGW